MIAAYLNRELVGGGVDDVVRFRVDENDQWTELCPPVPDAHIYVILFANNSAVVAGHIASELSHQHRFFWNWWFIGRLWKIKRALNNRSTDGDEPTFMVAQDDNTTDNTEGTE